MPGVDVVFLFNGRMAARDKDRLASATPGFFNCTLENRGANYSDTFQHRGVDVHFWRLLEAFFDDPHTRVAECPCNNLGASIVALKPRLRDKYPDSILHPLVKVYLNLDRQLDHRVKLVPPGLR